MSDSTADICNESNREQQIAALAGYTWNFLLGTHSSPNGLQHVNTARNECCLLPGFNPGVFLNSGLF